MTTLVAVIRFIGRLHLALANEIDDAIADYRIATAHVPDCPPAWLDEGIDLP